MSKLIVAVAALLGLGFVVVPITAMADQLIPMEPQRAQVYVLRPDVGANEERIAVSFDGHAAGKLDVNQYLVVSLPPGEHRMKLKTSQSSLETDLNLGPGEGAYLYIRIESSMLDYRMSADPISRDIAARYLVRSKSAGDRPVLLDTVIAPYVAAAPAPVAAPMAHATAPAIMAGGAAVAVPDAAGHGLPQGISIVTLGVADLERSVRFYTQALGLTLSSHSNRDIAFFELPGSWLALYSRAALAADAGAPVGASGGFPGMTLAHNVADRDSVDRILEAASAAGAVVVKPAQEAFWGGYSGYFKDPDGFFWEVAWNPQLPLQP